VISTAGWGYVNDLVLHPDGKMVVAGCLRGHFLRARYNADGSLDSSFGGGGKTPDDFSGIGGAFSALVLQPDGKLVAAGPIEDGFGRWAFALARHNADGSLDSSFGSGGKVTTNFGSGSFDQAYALVLQPDGKLVAAGLSNVSGGGGGGFTCFPFCPPPDPGTSSFALARYNADGSLDSSFGTDGKVITNFGSSNDQVLALVLQPDGKLVAAGGSNGNFALARYNANGSIDSSFGGGGTVSTNFGSFGGAAYALVLQPDGKLVAAGSGIPNFALARYTASGSLDPTFGSGGKVITDFGGDAYALVLQPDGKLVAAGARPPNAFALARYNANGSIDSSFGSAGKVSTNFGIFGGAAYALVLQPDGKLVAGGSGPCTTFNCNFIMARYQGGRPTAAASVGRGGGGDALIFPLIETTNLDTLIAIESFSTRTSVHKVRFRDAATGASVLEFELCLTPFSTWTASVFLEGIVTRVTSASTLLVNGSATPLNTTLTGNPTRAIMEVIGLRATTSPSSDTAICTDPSIGGDVENAALTGKAYYVKGDGSLPLVYGANAVALNNFAAATIADGTVFGNDVVAQALIGQGTGVPGSQSISFGTRYFVPTSFGAVTQVVLSFPTGPNSVGCPNCRVPSTLVIQAATEAGILLPTITLPSDITLVRVISLSSSDIANDSGLLQVREIASTPVPAVGFGINTTTAGAPLFFNALFPITID